jgi:hypothetical protein
MCIIIYSYFSNRFSLSLFLLSHQLQSHIHLFHRYASQPMEQKQYIGSVSFRGVLSLNKPPVNTTSPMPSILSFSHSMHTEFPLGEHMIHNTFMPSITETNRLHPSIARFMMPLRKIALSHLNTSLTVPSPTYRMFEDSLITFVHSSDSHLPTRHTLANDPHHLSPEYLQLPINMFNELIYPQVKRSDLQTIEVPPPQKGKWISINFNTGKISQQDDAYTYLTKESTQSSIQARSLSEQDLKQSPHDLIYKFTIADLASNAGYSFDMAKSSLNKLFLISSPDIQEYVFNDEISDQRNKDPHLRVVDQLSDQLGRQVHPFPKDMEEALKNRAKIPNQGDQAIKSTDDSENRDEL